MRGDGDLTTRVLKSLGLGSVGAILALPFLFLLPLIAVALVDTITGSDSSSEAAANAILVVGCLIVPTLTSVSSFVLSMFGSGRYLLRVFVAWLVIVNLASLLIAASSVLTPESADEETEAIAQAPSASAVPGSPSPQPSEGLSSTPRASDSQDLISPSPVLSSTPEMTQTPSLTPTSTSTPTPSSTPSATPTRTRTPIPAISLDDIYANFESMTQLQFDAYTDEIAGKPVREYVTVGNVSDDGKLSLRGPWSPFLFNFSDFCVAVTGTPLDVALEIDGGEVVYLEAIVNGIVGNYNYYINCENTLLLAYREIR